MLEILPRSKIPPANSDIEAKGQSTNPGDVQFNERLDGLMSTFCAQKSEILLQWTQHCYSMDEKTENKPRKVTMKELSEVYTLLLLEVMESI